jgi:hypothetical protein
VVAVVLAAAGPARADRQAADIDQVIRGQAGAIKACYQRELKRDPSVKQGGKVVVKFAIQKDGATARVRIDPKSTLRRKSLSSCIVGVFRAMRFGTDSGDAEISYPLLFSAP